MLSDAELLRYSRQILLDGWDLDAQIRLKNAHVLMVGAGGLGCHLAQTLVRAGVGRLDVIDHDTVDDSNLQRQILFTKDDIGKPKAQSAKVALERQNPLTDIHAHTLKITHETIDDYLVGQGVDLLIDCTDNFLVRDVLNQASVRHQCPLLSTSAIAYVGQVALFDGVGCYRCVFGDDNADEETCATSGVLSSTVAFIGALGAQVALGFLGQGINPIKGELLVWSGTDISLRKLKFNKDVSCPVCGKHHLEVS